MSKAKFDAAAHRCLGTDPGGASGHRQGPEDRSASGSRSVSSRLRMRGFCRLERQAAGPALFGGHPERNRPHRHARPAASRSGRATMFRRACAPNCATGTTCLSRPTPGTAFPPIFQQDFRPPKGVGVVLAQWHDQAELGDPSGKPPLAIRYVDGALRFTGAFSEVASQNPDKRYCLPRNPGHCP